MEESLTVLMLSLALCSILVLGWIKSRSSVSLGEICSMDWLLLVIAHPDDESMFFLPLIKSFQKTENIHILCLSNGGYDGLGQKRTEELRQCGVNVLGLKESNIHVINHPHLQDGPSNIWPSCVVVSCILDVIEGFNNKYSEKQGAIVSFDESGVSRHANHISTAKGLLDLASQNRVDNATFFTLESVNTLRKYCSFLDIMATLVLDSPIIVSHLNPWTNYKAMAAHYSQFVWFRKLFILFSRYTWINSFKLIPKKS